MADVFSTLRTINIQMSELYARQATLMKDRFGNFFEYYKNELDSIKEVFLYKKNKQKMGMMQDKLCSEYLKKEEQLYVKKEKLFDEGKVTSWEIKPEDLKIFDAVKLKADKGLSMQIMLPKVF